MRVTFYSAIAFRSTAIALLLLTCTIVTRTNDRSQDPSFRLMNIERRLDQLQSRVDFVERAQQNQAMQANTPASNLSTKALLELQRMNLSLAGQVVELRKRMLDMQKAIDRLAEHESKSDKKESAESKPKPKPAKP